METNTQICIIGQGYVGLPLAVEFGKKFPTIGFDIKEDRINELREGVDSTLECSSEELAESTHLTFTTQLDDIKNATVYIVTVPTPIDDYKTPNLTPLIKASEMLGKVVKKGDYVIYESTVYPGATEEDCLPLIEQGSGLKLNEDFFAGYSPERINPGDKEHRVTNILKVTSGSTPEAATFIDDLYKSIIVAGTHKAASIRVAEAAKVIENTQRDVNIALVNELSLIFDKMGIDTLEVLEAAGTKWNFLPFRPGLVGGHCIGVDPYYLTHKAQSIGYHPEIILSGRRINDNMSAHVAEKVLKLMTKKKIQVVDANILVMGLTFKENCPDIRNTKVTDVITELQGYHANIDVYDPWADAEEVKHEYGLNLISEPKQDHYDAAVICVSHDQIKEMGIAEIRKLCKTNNVIFDVKYLFDKDDVDARL
ncbi:MULTISPECIES: Vi polysaccharide biosynthesis UDP-N-acetylglucosamine C-6 dehydrogenase TviB [unclassified Oleiphilus]|nr:MULTISPECIES: Vi polysaccharide biosynthesis UDP-N-acetylglucosamine C-6 dehydrogenase TviB [unclassified Oleiphilus]KZY46928.1 Vi polysaccharide biosynthesis protein VipA/TviB [Oleiphilus sp. HI0050]KZY77464.1 Vi polysaccharide biosynthesis protein VipA/TviB [Oleiphilus sp. HI0068]KZY78502.1 Vi polysaccharide biosynthesis protein VipA/TviB [Oleiphilus sp. HI0069]KZY88966.1 Vi polysaccharide biosynthesis protein VipA/TviB [Oleiphilus sp. HI0072]KZZ23217.1 Vi polysaccharide biosynthesis prot